MLPKAKLLNYNNTEAYIMQGCVLWLFVVFFRFSCELPKLTSALFNIKPLKATNNSLLNCFIIKV